MGSEKGGLVQFKLDLMASPHGLMKLGDGQVLQVYRKDILCQNFLYLYWFCGLYVEFLLATN